MKFSAIKFTIWIQTRMPNIIIYSFISILPIAVAIIVYFFSGVPDLQNNLTPVIISYVWLGLLNAILDLGVGREFMFKSAKVPRSGILRTTKELILYQLCLVILFSGICLTIIPPTYELDGYMYWKFCIIFVTLNFCAIRKLFELHFQSKRHPLTQAIFAFFNACLDVFLLVILGLNLELYFIIFWSILRLTNLLILIYPFVKTLNTPRKIRVTPVVKIYFMRSVNYTLIMLKATFLKHYDKTIYFIFTSHPEALKFALTHLILQKIFFVATAVSVNSMSEYAQRIVNFSNKKLRSEFLLQRIFLTLSSVVGVSFYYVSHYIGDLLNFDFVNNITMSLLIGGYIINSWSRTLISYYMVNSPQIVIYAYVLAIITASIIDFFIYRYFSLLGTFWFTYNITVFVSARLYKMRS